MTIRRYTTTLEVTEASFEVTVAIDHDNPLSDEAINSACEHTVDYELVAECETNTDAFLKALAINCFRLQAEKTLNAYGVMKHYEDADGWPPLDGSWGIQLVDVDLIDFRPEYIELGDWVELEEMPKQPQPSL